MKILAALLLIVSTYTSVMGQEIPSQITEILARQQQAWNEGNIQSFMNGYWESDSLMFVGKSGITYGYQNTLQRYQRTYPNRNAMGTLSFNLLEFQFLGSDEFLVIGKWTLDRENDVLDGHFSLIWRKIKNQWKIVVDHSS